jgi:glutaredoxin 2
MLDFKLSLYLSLYCPYCVRVLDYIQSQDFIAKNIEVLYCNVMQDQHKQRLITYGGKSTVPCLLIESLKEKKETWLYESLDIIAYLKNL